MELITKLIFSPSTDIISKYNFIEAMLSSIYIPFALGLNIIKCVVE